MSLSASKLKVGEVHSARLVEDLKRTQIVQYAGASGDYNPLHTDEIFATKVAGYPSVFAHGMLTMGMTGRVVTDLVGVEGLLKFAMPQFQKEGKLYVTICVGCTGGRHRSVAVIEELRRRLGSEWDILVRHRDVERGP